ncbi:MAG TPA: hypothetical protein VFB13_15790 [Reyranella sp.]|jgi:hypothetical protein|nr:hypothetical protein [Reyranella sp.]
MAHSNSGNGLLYFIVGVLCAGIVASAFVLSGGLPSSGVEQAQAPAAAARQ